MAAPEILIQREGLRALQRRYNATMAPGKVTTTGGRLRAGCKCRKGSL